MKKISFRNDVLPLKDKLYRMALRITFDTAEAEDIVQDTLIKVWDKREEWPQLASIEAYCMTICRNLSLDRREKKEAQHIALDENLHNRHIAMTVRIAEPTDTPRVTSKPQQLQAMAQRNPALLKLKETFGLELN